MLTQYIWFFLLTLVSGQYNALIDENNSNITKVTTSNFAQFITSHDLILAEFVVPECPHSKMLLPDLEQVANLLKPNDIDVIQINCDEEDYICSELKISYYPTLRVFKNHKLAHSMNVEDDKSVNGLVDYMVAQNKSTVLNVSNESDLLNILNNQDNQDLFVVVNNGIIELNETFTYLAGQMFNTHLFINYALDDDDNTTTTTNINTTTINTTTTNVDLNLNYTIAQYKPFNASLVNNNDTILRDDPVIFEGNYTRFVEEKSDLKYWLQYSLLPPFADVKPDTFKDYIEAKLPLGYYFYWRPQDLDELTPFFTQLGEKYKGEINFIALDAKTYHGHVKYLNMREQFPLFGIHDMVHNRKYGIKQLPVEEYKALTEWPSLNQTEISELITDFMNGVAEPIVKSEDIPMEQNSNVMKLVAKNHDDIVLGNEKDVLVRYYSPLDPRNKKGSEDFLKVADVIASNEDLNSKIMFAEVNMQANDIISIPINSYPTVILYPTGNDTLPINIVGPKTPNFLMQILASNGTYHANVTEAYLKRYPDERVQLTEEQLAIINNSPTENQLDKQDDKQTSEEQENVVSQENEVIEPVEHVEDIVHDEL